MLGDRAPRRGLDNFDALEERWSLIPVFAGLTLAWLVLAWPWLSGTFTIPWDGKAHFGPQVQFLAASLARGEAPWWTPNVFAGHPQIADPQSMIFSPPMLILAAADASPSLWAIDAAVLLTVLLGGVGVVVFAWYHQWHWAGALLAAIVFMFGGSMAWRLQHFGQVMSLAYLPWAFLLIELAVRRGSILAGVGAGVAAAFILLGRDQVGLLAIYIMIAFALVQLLAGQDRVARLWSAVFPAIGGLVAGLAVIAVPLGLTLAFAEQSQRPVIDFAGAGGGSLHPGLLITLFAPNLFGAGGEMMDYWGPPSLIWENTGLFIAQNMGVIYLGALPLFLIAFALVRGWITDRTAAFFAIAAALMALYALGWYTPVFRAFYEVIPGVDKFRRPADATFLVGGLLAFVAGYGLHRLLTLDDEHRALRGFFLVSGAIALSGVAIAVGLAIAFGRFDGSSPDIAFSFATFIAMIAITAFAMWLRMLRPNLAGILLVAAVTIDLGLHNGPNGANALPTPSINMLQPEAPHPTIAKLQQLIAQKKSATVRPRIEFVGLGYHWPNASLTHGLENTLGANPVRLAWYAGATGAGDTVANFDQRHFTRLLPSYDSPLARLLGLTYVATSQPLKTDKGPGKGLRAVARLRHHFIYETPHPLPRVLFATNSIRRAQLPADAPPVPDLDYRTTVLLAPAEKAAVSAGEKSAPSAAVETATPAGQAHISEYRNTEVVIKAQSEKGGWVVLNDVWHPWWRVSVDGRPAELLRANVLFRGVKVPPGAHTIRFHFAPLSGAWHDLIFGQHLPNIDAGAKPKPARKLQEAS